MSIVLANDRKATLLEQKRAYLNTLTCRLFSNNITPDGTTVAADFVESIFPGYAPKPLVWPYAAFLNTSDQGELDATPLTWIRTGSPGDQLVYGYYVTDPGGTLVYSERRVAGPVNLHDAGQSYVLVPVMQEDTLV